MNVDYTNRYGKKPVIGVYTDGPENISDSADLWTIKYLGPLDPELAAITLIEPDYLARHIVRVHDWNLYPEYTHLLYVLNSESVDLTQLATKLDHDHNSFIDKNYKFALYRREVTYSIKKIDVGSHFVVNVKRSEDFSTNKMGVIFIDCWPIDFTWQRSHDDFNFYQNMIKVLERYQNIESYVFHTGFVNLDITTPDIVKYVNYFASDIKSKPEQWRAIQHLLEFSGSERLSPELNDILFNKKSILIPTLSGFENWINNTGIFRWLVVGMHWSLCTHDRALGFLNLKKLQKSHPLLQIYSLPSCTVRWVTNGAGHGRDRVARLCNKSDYDNDSLEWEYFGDIAQLK
jgi:hypothetical protein